MGPTQSSIYLLGTWALSSALSGQCVHLTTHLNIKPSARISGAIPVFPLYTFMACGQGKNFTLHV